MVSEVGSHFTRRLSIRPYALCLMYLCIIFRFLMILWHVPFLRDVLPPDSAPRGSAPVGVSPFNCKTLSLSSRRTENTRAIFPIARILFRITSLRRFAAAPAKNEPSVICFYGYYLPTRSYITDYGL